MKSRIWRLTGAGLLWVSVSAQGMADAQQNRGGPDRGRRQDGRGGNAQGYSGQPRPQSNEIIRGDNSRQFEVKPQNPGAQHYDRPAQDPNAHGRPPQPQPGSNLPIQGRPDSV
ncbi:glycine zipper family protein, partial [Pseudomonas ogarae]